MTDGILQEVLSECYVEHITSNDNSHIGLVTLIEKKLIAVIKQHEKEVETPYVSGLISVTWLIGE